MIHASPSWGEIITCIVTVASVFISYYLGNLHSKAQAKHDQALRRYNEFYVPFFTRLYAGRMWETAFSSLSLKSRSVFFDMITQHLSLLGPAMQSLYPAFYRAFLAAIDNPDSAKNCAALDTVFSRLVRHAIQESRALSKALCLSPIAATYETCLRKEHARRSKKAKAAR